MKKYAIKVVFQVRGDPPIHSPTWVIDAHLSLRWAKNMHTSTLMTVLQSQSKKLGQCPILAKKGIFFEKKGTTNFTTPYSNPFFDVLHQNKALHNFHKRGQYPGIWNVVSLIKNKNDHSLILSNYIKLIHNINHVESTEM